MLLDAKHRQHYHSLKYCGIHYTSKELKKLNSDSFIKSNKLLMYSASCHNIEEISLANKLNFDFITLSPVLSSKHSTTPIGWIRFNKLSLDANMPVFALGGISRSDINVCLLNNGYGISGISNFWYLS